jgi:drug/metabolite transporter (DMT)-like permease
VIKNIKNQKKAYLFALLAVLFWSTVATAFKFSLKELDYLEVLLYSSFFSCVVLFIILIFQGKLKDLKSSPKDLLFSSLLGFLNPFLYYVVLFKAYSLLPAQEALTLNYTWAIVVVLFSIPLLKQKITITSFFAILISFFGVATIATHGNVLSMKFANPFGVSLAVGSSLIWALFWVLNIKDKRDEIVKLFLNFAFGFIFILITSLIVKGTDISFNSGVWSALYIGLFEMGITFVVWLKALKYSETTAKVSNLIYLSPFFSLFIINIFLEEKILISTLFGLCLIILGIIIQQKSTGNIKA